MNKQPGGYEAPKKCRTCWFFTQPANRISPGLCRFPVEVEMCPPFCASSRLLIGMSEGLRADVLLRESLDREKYDKWVAEWCCKVELDGGCRCYKSRIEKEADDERRAAELAFEKSEEEGFDA